MCPRRAGAARLAKVLRNSGMLLCFGGDWSCRLKKQVWLQEEVGRWKGRSSSSTEKKILTQCHLADIDRHGGMTISIRTGLLPNFV